MADLDWKAIALRHMHPLATAILATLSENGHDSSPKQLADELGQPLGNVSYHVRRLVDAGLLELTRTEPRRGALEHFYRLSSAASQERA